MTQVATDISKWFTNSRATCVLFSQWKGQEGDLLLSPARVPQSGPFRCFHHCAERAHRVPGAMPHGLCPQGAHSLSANWVGGGGLGQGQGRPHREIGVGWSPKG